jgi:hypothetical protein
LRQHHRRGELQFLRAQTLDGRKHYYSLPLDGRIPSEVLSVKLVDFQKIGFVMRPNPAREQLQLRWQNEAEQLHQVMLPGAHGQPLLNWEWHGSETELQLPPLPAGHHFIRLPNSSTGAQWQQRLLLN